MEEHLHLVVDNLDDVSFREPLQPPLFYERLQHGQEVQGGGFPRHQLTQSEATCLRHAPCPHVCDACELGTTDGSDARDPGVEVVFNPLHLQLVPLLVHVHDQSLVPEVGDAEHHHHLHAHLGRPKVLNPAHDAGGEMRLDLDELLSVPPLFSRRLTSADDPFRKVLDEHVDESRRHGPIHAAREHALRVHDVAQALTMRGSFRARHRANRRCDRQRAPQGRFHLVPHPLPPAHERTPFIRGVPRWEEALTMVESLLQALQHLSQPPRSLSLLVLVLVVATALGTAAAAPAISPRHGEQVVVPPHRLRVPVFHDLVPPVLDSHSIGTVLLDLPDVLLVLLQLVDLSLELVDLSLVLVYLVLV
mmetsp:Transcript_11039/g.17725  ORF Transcript_11039/g.17725 Transcript_11039/m.17725 type:complete len:362 (+) Transcript_11039:2839-3924(+)